MPPFSRAVTIPTGRSEEETSESESNFTKSRKNTSATRWADDKRKGWLSSKDKTFGENMIYLGSLPCFFPRCYDYSHLWALVFKCSKGSYELGEFQPQVTENLPQTNLNNVKLDQHYWKSRCRLELWVDLISWLHFPRVLSDPLVYVRRGGGGIICRLKGSWAVILPSLIFLHSPVVD